MLTDMGTTTPSRLGGEHPNIAVERAVGSRSLAPTSDPEGPAREHRGGIIQDFLARCRREPQTDVTAALAFSTDSQAPANSWVKSG